MVGSCVWREGSVVVGLGGGAQRHGGEGVEFVAACMPGGCLSRTTLRGPPTPAQNGNTGIGERARPRSKASAATPVAGKFTPVQFVPRLY